MAIYGVKLHLNDSKKFIHDQLQYTTHYWWHWMMVGLNPERIMQGLVQLQHQDTSNRNFNLVADYSMPNVSEKMVGIILGYTDYVKRTVWSE